MNGWKIKKIDDKTFEIQEPKKPEINLAIVLALVFLFLFCKFRNETEAVLDYFQKILG